MVTTFLFFVRSSQTRNPNNGVDVGSIPTSHEEVSFFGKCAKQDESETQLEVPIVRTYLLNNKSAPSSLTQIWLEDPIEKTSGKRLSVKVCLEDPIEKHWEIDIITG